MTQAAVVYRHNQQPRRGLALAGLIFFVKSILLVPHFIILNALSNLAWVTAYVGYWIVAFTGKLPPPLQALISWMLRWNVRVGGWLAGITDEYPPFDYDPPAYPIDAKTPVNERPSTGWAVAGIFVIPKAICLIPHLFVLFFAMVAAVVVTWVGYLVTSFTGRFPTGMQDFIAGTLQWYTRVVAWFFGLTDEYPPFGVSLSPAV
jgi:hypothetical protein